MSYEFGSESLDIKNPFQQEGFLLTARGAVVTVLGVVLLLSVKELVDSGEKPEAWGHMLIGMFLLLSGLTASGRGLFRMFRFFVGRGIPAGLCENYAQDSGQSGDAHVAYDSSQIAQMLMGRKNITFIEPTGWISRLICTILPKLIYMPYPVRNITQQILAGLIFTLLGFTLYGLALFSGSTGLVTFTQTPAADWFGAGLTAAVLLIWFDKSSPLESTLKDAMMKTVAPGNVRGLAVMIAAAVLLPFGLDWLHTIWPLPEIPIAYLKWMVMITGLACITVASGIGLALLRMKTAQPLTEVSEYKDHWQENLHPMDIFRAFGTVMADYRYKEIPNRVYREFDPRLMIQGSEDKGDFKGDIIQETQPVSVPANRSAAFQILRLTTGTIAQLLALLSAVCIFRAADGPTFITPNHIADLVLPPLVFWIFSAILQKIAHIYWAEVDFKSHLVHFFTEGTYTESKLSTGMSIYDSTRSENPVVRSSLTPWVLASEIVTCTFADSGSKNLENFRHILEMHKNEALLGDIVRKLRTYMDERQVIAGLKSQSDLETAGNMYRINTATRPSIPGGQPYPPPLPARNQDGDANSLPCDGNDHYQSDAENREPEDS